MFSLGVETRGGKYGADSPERQRMWESFGLPPDFDCRTPSEQRRLREERERINTEYIHANFWGHGAPYGQDEAGPSQPHSEQRPRQPINLCTPERGGGKGKGKALAFTSTSP